MSNVKENIGAYLSDHKSGILISLGIIAELVCVVTACVATSKAVDILDDHNKALEDLDQYDTEESKAKELTRSVYKRTTISMVKTYAVPALLCAGSITCIIAGYKNEKKNKEAAMAVAADAIAAVVAIKSAFNDYRERVIEKYGEQADYDIYMGRKETVTTEEHIDPKTGKKKTRKVVKVSYDPINYDIYRREFGPWSSVEWTEDPKKNISTYRSIQTTSTHQLDGCGYFSVVDGYQYWGIDTTVGVEQTEPFVPNSIGWVSEKIFNELPEEWDYKGRHYVKSDYSSKIDWGITPDRLEEANHAIFHGLPDDVYILRPNCYPMNDILEFASKYIAKKKTSAIAIDRKTLNEFDHAHNMNI